jgi:atypical dual specificity phosphatase
VLHDGADWIHEQLGEKRTIYCHCKSGIGRSTSVIAAYYIKYKKMSAVDTLNFIRQSRPCIIGPKSSQTKNLIEFEESIRQERKSHFEA